MNQAKDIADVLDTLHIASAGIVGHDIGNMVAFAFAERYPERTTRLVMMDAPVPGVGPWDDILKSPLLWHFRFGGVDMERLVAGRERIYLDRFWNDFAADPSKFDEAARAHYAELYSMPGHMHAGQTSVLTQGAFYTEPANTPHFAFTGDQPATVFITGTGPSDTHFEKDGPSRP